MSSFFFQTITGVNVNGFSPNGVSIGIVEIWCGIANGQIWSIFFIFDIYLPMRCPYFHFQVITSKYQWIFTKLGMCIDIVEILFGLLMAKFHQFLAELSACNTSVFSVSGQYLE